VCWGLGTVDLGHPAEVRGLRGLKGRAQWGGAEVYKGLGFKAMRCWGSGSLIGHPTEVRVLWGSGFEGQGSRG
jgi:hypothetical protein